TFQYTSVDAAFTGTVVVHGGAGDDTFVGSSAGGTYTLTGAGEGTYVPNGGGPTVEVDGFETIAGTNGPESMPVENLAGDVTVTVGPDDVTISEDAAGETTTIASVSGIDTLTLDGGPDSAAISFQNGFVVPNGMTIDVSGLGAPATR